MGLIGVGNEEGRRHYHISTLFQCPCGWFRDFCYSPDWKNQILSHPIYGTIDNMTLATMDVHKHDCSTYKTAVEALRARRLNNANVA